jgi:hypothetical protein
LKNSLNLLASAFFPSGSIQTGDFHAVQDSLLDIRFLDDPGDELARSPPELRTKPASALHFNTRLFGFSSVGKRDGAKNMVPETLRQRELPSCRQGTVALAALEVVDRSSPMNPTWQPGVDLQGLIDQGLAAVVVSRSGQDGAYGASLEG